jgi:hypothetical protein
MSKEDRYVAHRAKFALKNIESGVDRSLKKQ